MLKNRKPLIYLGALLGFLSLICVPALAQSYYNGQKIQKTFSVLPDALIRIQGKYGNIHINTWEKLTAEVSIELIVKGGTDEDINTIIDRMTIEVKGDQKEVGIITDLEGVSHWNIINADDGPQLEIRFKDGEKVILTSFSFDYTLNIPRTNHLKVDALFSDLYLDDMIGKTEITLKYANLQVKKLQGPSLVNLSYSKGRLDQVGHGNWNVLHSQFSIESVDYLKMITQYSEINIDRSDSLISHSKYNTYRFGKVNYLVAEEKNSELWVNHLSAWGDIHMEYGSLAVKQLDKEFKNLNLEGSYTDMDIQVEKDANYELQLSSKYADIAFPEILSVSQDVETEDSRKIIGSLGKAAKSNIHVSARHGKILIK
ncbi:MAG: DUF4097 family beta strand repeat protein [Bacteroidetes bacterium]|nr:DUF4097 family beta strand repeat protein [Bacteroidota bacterium]MCB0841833.1 DUF4097 family beta strand repeat protein [Bacteroidota bacterium]